MLNVRVKRQWDARRERRRVMAGSVETKKKSGRPTDFTKELATDICMRLIELGSLRKVCKAEDMPDKATVFRWLLKADEDGQEEYSTFRDQYAQARRISKEYRFDEHWEELEEEAKTPLLDSDGLPVMIDGKPVMTTTAQSIAFARLKHDAFKWQASKEDPKKYGEFNRTEVSGVDGKPVETITTIQLVALDDNSAD